VTVIRHPSLHATHTGPMLVRMPLPDTIDMVTQLVREPSVSSPDPARDQSNRQVIARLAEWCEHLGFRVEVMPLEDETKANLIATLGDGEGGLVLSGHSDTVPFDERLWETDPLDLVAADDGKLFGRGSADMKGFFGAALTAAQRFRADQLKHPLILLATADEESTMNGARALVEAKRPTATRAVIGEPTSLRPVHMHKGIAMEKLELTGLSGHSSDPALGRSALEGMLVALQEIVAFRGELQLQYRNEAFAVPSPTLNLGRIEGGDSPNRICPSCSLTFDLRTIPGMDPATTREALRVRIEEALAPHALDVAFDELVASVPPFATSEEASIVRAAAEHTGLAPQAVMFCTEAPFLAELGMETLVCGPGSIDVAHQPNEHTSRQQLEAATELYASLVHRFCVDAD